MSKHTPGPWKAIISENVANVVCAENGIGVARVIDDDDARLIAAAPQMLEALEACAAYWHYKRSPGIPEHSELVSLSAEQAQKLIRAAIAAAKGEV